MLERQGREGRALQAHLASSRKGQASLTVAGEGGEGLASPRASSLKLPAGSWVPETSLGLAAQRSCGQLLQGLHPVEDQGLQFCGGC